MRTIRRRLVLVAAVVGVATLSVGATAYAAGHAQAGGTSLSAQAGASAAVAATAAPAMPRPTPVPTATAVATPDVDPAADDSAPAEVAPADSDVPSADGTSDALPGTDGNVVEVRTPNPAAVPQTLAERDHFYSFVTECMASAGFDWHAVVSMASDGTFKSVSMTTNDSADQATRDAFELALYGDTGGGDYYHWADAGCWGYAVHVTGNDGNN